MKKLLKAFLFIVIFNFICSAAFLTWITFSAIRPAMKYADISFKELISNNISPEKMLMVDKYVTEKSSELGKKASKMLMNSLKKLVPSDIDFSKMPNVEYPYPSLDEVLELSNEAAEKGISEGLKSLEEAQKR